MNIKSILLYAFLVCGGFGAGVAVSPSQNDIDQAVIAAKAALQQDCGSMSDSDREFRRAKPRNTPSQGF